MRDEAGHFNDCGCIACRIKKEAILQTKIAELEADKSVLMERDEKYTNTISGLQTENLQLQDKVEALTLERDDSEHCHKTSDQNRSKWQKEAGRLQAKVEALSGDNEQLAGDIGRAMDFNTELLAKVEELKDFIRGFMDVAEPHLPEKMCNEIKSLLTGREKG